MRNLREAGVRIGLSMLAVGAITACSESQQATPTKPTLPAISEPTKILPIPTFLPTRTPLIPTPFPTITPRPPTPRPENTPLPKTKIEIARIAQEEAFRKGEFRIPLPEALISAIDFTINVGQVRNPDGTHFLTLSGLKTGQSVNFPALMDGEITAIYDQPFARTIDIRKGNDYLRIQTVLSTKALVTNGENVKLGDPLFSFTYTPDADQQTFSRLTTNHKWTDVIIAIRYLSNRDGTLKPQDLSNDKGLLRNQSNTVIYIPTLQ